MTTKAEPAAVLWSDEQIPTSTQFDDLYYSRDDGLAESRHVFIRGNRLGDRFADGSCRVVAELGFGTGLNFLACVEEWTAQPERGEHLHYISFERFPLSSEDIARALKPFTTLVSVTDLLLKRYPPPVQGFHRIHFPEFSITLTLILGDAREYLPEVSAEVDAWFLDGFAPAKNPELWEPGLFQEIKRLSAPQASFATFSAARVVRDNAQAAGFLVQRTAGFGRKRDMLVGQRSDPTKPIRRQAAKRALVIGGGLAGACVAHSLSQRGIEVELFEREQELAQHSSGNAAGIFMSYAAKGNTAMSRFQAEGFEFMLRQLTHLRESGCEIAGEQCGVLQLACTERIERVYQYLLGQAAPPEQVQAISLGHASELAGVSLQQTALYYPRGGWLSPPEYCRALLNSAIAAIKVRCGEGITAMRKSGNYWQLLASDGNPVAEAEIVVVANAYEAERLTQCAALGFGKIRGQTMLLPATEVTSNLHAVLIFDGYLVPAYQGNHFLGSTYDRGNDSLELVEAQAEELIERLRKSIPALDSPELRIGPGRAAFRTTTPDRLPLVGSLANAEGLFVSLAHGSRGLVSCGLAAELIAGHMCSEPLPVSKEIVSALDPERFARGRKRSNG
jgi:tRNA 5-methylaminomethyl-2-thiouridine biosynthesis bifunctional protein